MSHNNKLQPITELPLFAQLVNKMVVDTKSKISRLEEVLADKKYITDDMLASMMYTLHRQLENKDALTKQFNKWLSEANDPITKNLVYGLLNNNQKVDSLSKECWDLAELAKYKTIEAVADKLKVADSHVINSRYKSCGKFNLNEQDVKYYHKVRRIFRDIYPKITTYFSRDIIDFGARRLEITDGKQVFLNTKHELDVLFEYSFYCFKRDGLNVYERAYNKLQENFNDETLKIFNAVKNAYFVYLEIIGPAGDSGVIVFDRVHDKESLMIDVKLNELSKSLNKYYLVSHIIDCDEFIMTAGASTPVAIYTAEGLRLQRRFEKYLNLVYNNKADNKSDAQYITDMFKIILHEDITGKVASEPMVYNEAQIHKDIFGDIVH
jgi:hypothetical protein